MGTGGKRANGRMKEGKGEADIPPTPSLSPFFLCVQVAGFSPYEKRVMELLRNSKDKKARKLTKKRVRLPLLLLCLPFVFVVGQRCSES